MKYSTVALTVASVASNVAAFPYAAIDQGLAEGNIEAPNYKPLERRASPGFDAKKQYVSTSGKYAFVPPGPSDLRGPCPGLNALANHNYLPHNGVANIEEFISSTYDVFGMGKDLGGFLAVYGAVFDGDLTSWSIGGPQPASLTDPLAPLLGQPQGISGSHNKYECDVSPTRPDLYLAGQDYKVKVPLFKGLYEKQANKTNEESNYDLDVLEAYRVERFQDSMSRNPYFFNGPFSGFQVQPAAYTFIFRFMGNRSQEYPEGRLSQEVLKSFFSIKGTYPNFTYKEGWEQIPDNWYRRAYGDEYTIPFFEKDLLGEAVRHPQFLDIGGNTGKVNTFTGIDVANLTNGVYNFKTLSEGDNAMCFAYQFLQQATPDILKGGILTTAGLNKAISMVNTMVDKVTAGLGCPQLEKIDASQFQAAFSKYPGWTKLNAKGYYSGRV